MKLSNEPAALRAVRRDLRPWFPGDSWLTSEGKERGRHPRGGKVCEYCGCQALAPIAELTEEHDLVLGLACEARAARDESDLSRMAGLASQIAAVLGPHTQVEERGLFPALAADFPDQMAILEAEHQQIAAVLGEASSGPPEDPAWPDRLTAALALLRAHIHKEQDGVFPAALATLRTADWEAMENIRTRAGSQLPSPA